MASGAANAVVLAMMIAALVVASQVADLLAARGIIDRAEAFRAAAADVLVLDAPAAIDGDRCAALGKLAGVQAAGAVRSDAPAFAAAAPTSSIPVWEVTAGVPEVFGATPDRAGMVVSHDVAEHLGIRQGEALQLTDRQTTVAAEYASPQDGRRSGFGFAMLSPTTDRAPFDACLVRAWPASDAVANVLPTAVLPGAAEGQALQVVQWNTSLGATYDADRAFRERPTRFLPVVVFVISVAIGIGSLRLRRLELATARHLGTASADLVAMRVLEAMLWLLPVVVVGAVAAAALAASLGPADVATGLALAAWSPLAAALGVLAGVGIAAGDVGPRDIYRAFKER